MILQIPSIRQNAEGDVTATDLIDIPTSVKTFIAVFLSGYHYVSAKSDINTSVCTIYDGFTCKSPAKMEEIYFACT